MRAGKTAIILCLTFPLTQYAWGAEATPPLRLAATSKWRMDYADDSCALLRGYGKDDSKVLMSKEQFALGDSFYLTLAGKPARTADETREIRIRFGPNEDWQSFPITADMARTGSLLPLSFRQCAWPPILRLKKSPY